MEKSMINNKLRSVISLVDKLRDINLESYIQLPKIVAVGSQSSGKSSLIEQIVGLDFLPRGSGVVTRRPLQIRMNYDHNLKQPYALFQEIPGKRITDFNQVKSCIQQLTDKVCGKNKNIVDKAIILNVFSCHCPNLTIIDLPGLTRIAIQSQSSNIYEITSNMIKKYMRQPNTIMLCVIAANQDITNDQVLDVARKIDPEGQRTIGCITKIDIMDRGTDARELLMNKSQVKLKLGFVGIKNRSQEDINQKKTVQQALQNEKMFFSKSPIYSSLPIDRVGTASLVNTLTKVLSHSIVKFLPQLVEKIKERKAELSHLMKEYGKPLPKTNEQKQSLIWQVCSELMRQIKKCIKGQVTILKKKQALQKINFHIQEELRTVLMEEAISDPTVDLTDQKILFALRKFQGSNLPGFPSISSFLYLLEPLIQKMKYPLIRCLQQVFDSLVNIVQIIVSQVAHEYYTLRQSLSAKTTQILLKFKEKAEEYINLMMEAEIGYIYVNNPLFDQLMNKEQTANDKKSELVRQNPLILVIRKRVMAYYIVIAKNLRDLIPKSIVSIMLKNAIDDLQFEIFQFSSVTPEKADQFLSIGEAAIAERIKKQKEYDTICKAQQFLLTHAGLAEFRKAELEKRRIKRQKQLEQAKKKQVKKKPPPPRQPESSPKKKVQNSPIAVQSSPRKQINISAEKPMIKEKKPTPMIIPSDEKTGQVYTQRPVIDLRPSQSSPKNDQKKIIHAEKTEGRDRGNTNLFAQLFGPSKKAEDNTADNSKTYIQNPSDNTRKTNTFVEPPTKNKQQFTAVYNRQVGKATDRAVDELYKNQKFKEKSKQAVQGGTSMAVQKQFGVSESTGNTLGKGAGWLFGTDLAQNYMKEQTKKAVRNQTQMQKK